MAADYQLLAQYLNRPVQSTGPNTADIAKFILLNAQQPTGPAPSANPNDPSVMSRIFDILSRPNYAVANFAKGLAQDKPNIADLWKGFSGQEKTTFKDVLAAKGVTDPTVKSVLGTGLDIATDPLNFLPVGTILNKFKNLSGIGKGATILDKPYAQQLLSKGEPAVPEAFGLPNTSGAVPLALKAPGAAERIPADLAAQLPTPSNIKITPPDQLSLPLDIPKTPDILAKPLDIKPPVGQIPKELKGQAAFNFPGLNISKTKKGITDAQNAIAKNLQAMQDAQKVKPIVDKSLESKVLTNSSNLVSNEQMKGFDDFLKNFGKATAQATGVSKDGIDATGKLIKMAIQSGKTSAEIAVENSAKMLDNVIATGKASPKANEVLTRALEKDLGTLPKWAVNDNKATESLMGRVATWWGQKDLRPLSLNAIGSSAATAATRGQVLGKLFKGFSDPETHEALKLAQGVGKANTSETAQLATQIKRMMDNLVGQVSGTSVLTKSGVDMNLLNKWMKQYGTGFEFTNKKSVRDIFGGEHDFSKGTDWVNSWKTANITEDPKQFLFKIQQSMEQATREKALYDEIGERFGSKFVGNGYKVKITGHPYLDGYYFPEDIAKQIPRVIKDWSLPAWKPGSPLLKQYDRVMSMWKTGVTIYRPGHHLRNLAGDIYLGWMDGVNTMKPYLLAARVQRSMRGAYQDLSDVDKLVEMGALSKNYATPKPNEILFRNKSGVPFTSEQIAAVAHQKGLLEHTKSIEDIIDLGNEGRKSLLNAKPFGGRVQAVARGASELINHNTRLAHFIDKVAKSKGKDLAAIFESASRRARKWHPTGLDLTNYEKNVLRRVIPFYSWIRKSTPLLLEGLLMNPAKALVPAKIAQGLQGIAGINTSRDNPFPVDQMFPSWIREQGIGPISVPQGFLGQFSANQPPGYTMAGIGLDPLIDLVGQLQNPGQTIASGLTPGLRIPMELMTGQKSFSGEPFLGPDARPGALGQYVGEQVPIYSAFQGLTGITPLGGQTKKAAQTDNSANVENLVNFLTAAGIKGTGPYIKQARFEKVAPLTMQKKLQKEGFLSQLRNTLGG